MTVSVPQAFWFDLRFTLSRLGAFPLPLQVPVVMLNYYHLLTRDVWFLAGLVGMFLAYPARWRWLLLTMFLFPLISLGRTTGFATGLEDYYLIALFPMIAIGVALLVWVGFPYVLRTFQDGLRTLFSRWGWRPDGWLSARLVALAGSLGLFLLVISPFFISPALTLRDVTQGFSPRIDPVLVSPGDAGKTSEFINQHVRKDDLVIASPAVAWAFAANAADFQQSLAAVGIATRHFPADIPADRFVFNPSLSLAKYVVVDRIWRNWGAANMPEVAAMLDEVADWPQVFSAGEFTVYQKSVILNEKSFAKSHQAAALVLLADAPGSAALTPLGGFARLRGFRPFLPPGEDGLAFYRYMGRVSPALPVPFGGLYSTW